MKKPTTKQVKYALDSCGCGCYYLGTEKEDIEAVKKAYRESKKGMAFSLCRAICRVKCYWSKEEFDVLLDCVEHALSEYQYDKEDAQARKRDRQQNKKKIAMRLDTK